LEAVGVPDPRGLAGLNETRVDVENGDSQRSRGRELVGQMWKACQRPGIRDRILYERDTSNVVCPRETQETQLGQTL
jgi:hypothetical protein